MHDLLHDPAADAAYGDTPPNPLREATRRATAAYHTQDTPSPSPAPPRDRAADQREFDIMMALRHDPANIELKRQADQLREAKVQRERDMARAPLRALIAADARRTANDPASLRAVLAWQRTTPNVRLAVTDKTALAALRAEGQRFDADLAANDATVRAAETQFQAERLLRLVRGAPPVAIPARLEVTGFLDDDAVARWLVFHEGGYVLTVGQWVTIEERDEETDAVTGTSRTLRHTVGLGGIEAACERWATWRRFDADAVTHPEEAERLATAGLDVLGGDPQYRELIAEQSGLWSFEPDDSETTPEPEKEARKGRRPMRPETLEERVERGLRAYWKQHNRGPGTVEDTARGVKGKRSDVLKTIHYLMSEEGGYRIVVTEKGLRLDE